MTVERSRSGAVRQRHVSLRVGLLFRCRSRLAFEIGAYEYGSTPPAVNLAPAKPKGVRLR